MKRRVSGIEFASVWGKVSRWGQQDRDDLVKLLCEVGATKVEEPKKREPRKPKDKPEGGAG